jgi:cysteinyl-tRNA synthetase
MQIILRARESHLLSETITSHPSLTPDLLSTSHSAFSAYFSRRVLKSLPTPIPAPGPNATALDHFTAVLAKDAADAEFARAMRDKEEKWGMYLSSLSKSRDAILTADKRLEDGQGQIGSEAVQDLVEGASDVLGPWLGETLADTIADPISVSRTLASYWENKFFEDMARLRVLPPDTITRVSEYVPEIVNFVQKIVDNGFAYEGGGSIWFDVGKFEGAEGDGFRHEYAKLQPGNKGNKKLLDEGEGG